MEVPWQAPRPAVTAAGAIHGERLISRKTFSAVEGPSLSTARV